MYNINEHKNDKFVTNSNSCRENNYIVNSSDCLIGSNILNTFFLSDFLSFKAI